MIACNVPFCDYLTVTYSDLEGSPFDTLPDFLTEAGLWPVYGDKPGLNFWSSIRAGIGGKALFSKCVMVKRHGQGLIITVYGTGMEYFREHKDGVYLSELMAVLSEHRHNLTRCDISMDIDIDTPDFFLEFLPKVSDGYFAIRRDSLKVTRVITVRDDGQESGTVYIGKDSSARVKGSIYDKQLERREKAYEIIGPRTRIEFRLGKEFGASLYDAMAPDSLFWELAHPCGILKNKPAGIPKWIKRENYSRTPQPRVQREVNHYETLKELVYENPIFPALIEYTDKNIGDGGRKQLINIISSLINSPAMGMGITKPNE
ncbi:replication initiation factor domain-containing protein [Salmonella enterica subsp. enterica serovar Newport]